MCGDSDQGNFQGLVHRARAVEAAWRLSKVTRYNASASMYLADKIFVSKVVTTFCATCKGDRLYIGLVTESARRIGMSCRPDQEFALLIAATVSSIGLPSMSTGVRSCTHVNWQSRQAATGHYFAPLTQNHINEDTVTLDFSRLYPMST